MATRTAREVSILLTEEKVNGPGLPGVVNADSFVNPHNHYVTPEDTFYFFSFTGNRRCEITCLFGYILATIADNNILNEPDAPETIAGHCLPDTASCQDDYPFGMLAVGRNWESASSEGYKFGFNGMEQDDDLKGEGNSYNFGARIYDPRLGRWFSTDRAENEYPSSSTYSFALNCPIQALDVEGTRTYFVGGAGYNPHPGFIARLITKIFAKEGTFATETEKAFTELLGSEFKMVESASLPYGLVSGSVFALLFGSKPILHVERFDNIQNTVNEIANDYNANKINPDGSTKPLNLIGSSYGSVVVAQAAVEILTNPQYNINYITSLTLSASPIDTASALYHKILELKNDGKIGEIIYDPNPGDNVTGSAGENITEGILSLGELIEGEPSILSAKHPHNKAGKDKSRVYDRLIQKILIEAEAEGTMIKSRAELIID